MMEYPFTSARILNDSNFVMYGGRIGTSTSQVRAVAYLLAEEQMTEHLNSFVIPTVITGTVTHARGNLFVTEFGHVRNVFGVNLEVVKNISPFQTEVHTGSAVILDAQNGYINVFTDCQPVFLHRVTAVYESGLASGTSMQGSMMTALAMAAQINLNELDVSLANEGVADIGIQRFSNQAYSEERKHLLNTVFGNSAASQRIARLVKKYRSRPAIGLR